MKFFYVFIIFLLSELSAFSVPNKVITGRINPITIEGYSIFNISKNIDNEDTYSFKTSDLDKNTKVYEISEQKGNFLIISYVSL